MGLDYAYELACLRRDGPKLIAALCPSLAACGHTTEIEWGGALLTVPASVAFKDARVAIDTKNSVTLDTVIWLPDEPAAYGLFADEPERRQRVGEDGVTLLELAQGYIYLTIECGPKICRFTFAAPTSDTSRYFQDSKVLRSWFVDLGRRTGCTSILFDAENDDKTRLCVLTGSRVPQPPLD